MNKILKRLFVPKEYSKGCLYLEDREPLELEVGKGGWPLHHSLLQTEKV
jgi:hypothetical protein